MFLLVQLSSFMSNTGFGIIFMHFDSILMEIWGKQLFTEILRRPFWIFAHKTIFPHLDLLGLFFVILDTFLACNMKRNILLQLVVGQVSFLHRLPGSLVTALHRASANVTGAVRGHQSFPTQAMRHALPSGGVFRAAH